MSRQVVKKKREKLLLVVNFVLLTVGFISSLLTIISLLTPFFKTTFFIWLVPLQSLLIPLSFFVLGVCVTFLGTQVYNSIYSKFNPVRWFLYGYKWVNADYRYCIEDTTKMHHSQLTTITIRATRIGVSIFENKYSWSGHGKQESLEVMSNGHELMGSITKQQNFFPFNRWKYYYVFLGHELPLEENVVISIKQALYDEAGKFRAICGKNNYQAVRKSQIKCIIARSTSFC